MNQNIVIYNFSFNVKQRRPTILPSLYLLSFRKYVNKEHRRLFKSGTDLISNDQMTFTNDSPAGKPEKLMIPLEKKVWCAFEEKFKLLNYAEERQFSRADENKSIISNTTNLEREIMLKKREVDRIRLEQMFSDKKMSTL